MSLGVFKNVDSANVQSFDPQPTISKIFKKTFSNGFKQDIELFLNCQIRLTKRIDNTWKRGKFDQK